MSCCGVFTAIFVHWYTTKSKLMLGITHIQSIAAVSGGRSTDSDVVTNLRTVNTLTFIYNVD